MSRPSNDALATLKRQHRVLHPADAVLSTLSPNLGRSSLSSTAEHDFSHTSSSSTQSQTDYLRLRLHDYNPEDLRSSSNSNSLARNGLTKSDSFNLDDMARQMEDTFSSSASATQPPAVPAHTAQPPGASTTKEPGQYPQRFETLDQSAQANQPQSDMLEAGNASAFASPRPSSPASDMFATPATHLSSRVDSNFGDEDEVDYGDSTLADDAIEEATASSPAAAAAQRRHPYASISKRDYSYGAEISSEHHIDSNGATPTQQLDRSIIFGTMSRSARDLPLWPSTSTNDSVVVELENGPEDDSAHGELGVSAQAQLLSLAQSPRSDQDDSDSWLGTDPVLPSSTPIREKRDLGHSMARMERLPSFGSIASAASDASSTSSVRVKKSTSALRSASYEQALDRLATENIISKQADLTTPRASTNVAVIPTDTVLARHVREIQVPNTVAKEYRAANNVSRATNYDKTTTPPFSRTKGDLTLKEQNSKIDKLTKENFDLKLKIHFLSQALQSRSEESVNNIITQNAQLQADLVGAKKDNQTLRRQIKDLEGKVDATPLPSSLSEEEAHAQSVRYSQLEADILYLQDTMRSLEEENRKLALEEERSTVQPVDHSLVERLRAENTGLRRDLVAQTSMLTSRNRERERLQFEIENLRLAQMRMSPRPGTRGSAASSNYHRPSTSNASTDSALLQRLQLERDEALLRLTAAENQFEQDNQYALSMIEDLDETVLQKQREIDVLVADLQARESDIHTLQREIHSISAGLDRIADDREASQMTIQELERDLLHANGELEALERVVRELTAVKEQLEVQQDCSRTEVAFLREEQERDQVKLSGLTTALASAQASLAGDKERLRELEELRVEIDKAREEIVHLRRSASTHEADSKRSQDKLADLEDGLREALDSVTGTGSGLLAEVVRTQRELAGSLQQLEEARAGISHKDGLLKDRETLLEATSLDVKRHVDFLDKERQAHAQSKHELKRLQAIHMQRDPQLAALEAARLKDKQALEVLQSRHTAQLRERHELLLQLWTRLRKLSPSEHGAASGKAFSSADGLVQNLGLFSQHLLSTVDAVATGVEGLRARVKDTEHDLSRDVASLATHLDSRNARLSKLETLVSKQQATASPVMAKSAGDDPATNTVSAADFAHLRAANERLQREIRQLRQGTFALPGLEEVPAYATDIEHLRAPRLTPATMLAPLAPAPKNRPVGLPPIADVDGAASGEEQDTTLTPSGRHRVASTGYVSAIGVGAGTGTNAGSNPTVRHGRSGSSASAQATGRPSSASAAGRPSLSGATSASASTDMARRNSSVVSSPDAPAAASQAPPQPQQTEAKWVMRFKEMERRLRSEREGRLLDRDGARRRLDEGRRREAELQGALERERVRKEAWVGGAGDGGELRRSTSVD